RTPRAPRRGPRRCPRSGPDTPPGAVVPSGPPTGTRDTRPCRGRAREVPRRNRRPARPGLVSLVRAVPHTSAYPPGAPMTAWLLGTPLGEMLAPAFARSMEDKGMTDSALFIGWGATAAGRERRAVELF